jgi:hypothetical protein
MFFGVHQFSTIFFGFRRFESIFWHFPSKGCAGHARAGELAQTFGESRGHASHINGTSMAHQKGVQVSQGPV